VGDKRIGIEGYLKNGRKSLRKKCELLWIAGPTVDANFVVKVRPCRATCIARERYLIPAAHLLSDLNQSFREMGIPSNHIWGVVHIDNPAVGSVVSYLTHYSIARGHNIATGIEREVHPFMKGSTTREGRHTIAIVRGNIPLDWISDRKSPKSLREGCESPQEIGLRWRMVLIFSRRRNFIEGWTDLKGDVPLPED
jgi:hypothetical protein